MKLLSQHQQEVARLQREKDRKEAAEEAKKLQSRKTIGTKDVNPQVASKLKKATTMIKSPKKK